ERSDSGEAGWVPGHWYDRLARGGGPARVVARGMVPEIGGDHAFTTEVRLLVDGREVARRTVGVGDFELAAPAPEGAGRQRVELRFSNHRPLPGDDGRPVSAQLRSIGFEPAEAVARP